MQEKQAIIIHGNPVDGFNHIGPFNNRHGAIEHGNTDAHIDGDWWVAELEPATDGARDDGSDTWAERQGHPIADWQYEVANGDTRRGYRDWCIAREEQMPKIQPGTKARFNYPPEFTTMPDHTAHAGQIVTVLERKADAEAAAGLNEYVYKIQAEDGWLGEAFESELEPVEAQA